MKNTLPANRSRLLTLALAGALASSAGCAQQSSNSPRLGPVGQVEPRYNNDRPKPLPGPESAELPPPPFSDVPLVYQRPPEQKMFVDGYNAVGRPRMAVFVNRSLLGDALPVEAAVVPDRVPPTYNDPIRGNPFREEPHAGDSYLRPGQYDEASAKQIDYATLENVLTQWLAADGQTTIASPSVVRERLTAEEINKLQAGRPRMLGELAKELNADVLIYVQARPTRQTERGLEIRLNAEAINIAHGEQIARATVLIPPPLDTEQINRYTRFIGRKLMSDMAMTWSSPGPAAGKTGPATDPAAPAMRPPPRAPEPVSPLNEVPEPPARSPSPEPAAPQPAPNPAPVPSPAPPMEVPAEKPSLLDRTDASTTQRPVEDFPPPPASATREITR